MYGDYTDNMTSRRTSNEPTHPANFLYTRNRYIIFPLRSCEAHYIGETERSLKSLFDELKRPSSIASEVSRHIHKNNPDHTISMENARILTTETCRWFERGIKEDLSSCAYRLTLNRGGLSNARELSRVVYGKSRAERGWAVKRAVRSSCNV